MSQSIPVSQVVNVTKSVVPQFPPGEGFGLLCLFSNSTALPTGQRTRLFANAEAVSAFFGSSSQEAEAANVYFGQSESPSSILIARRFGAATAGELLGASFISFSAQTLVLETPLAIYNAAQAAPTPAVGNALMAVYNAMIQGQSASAIYALALAAAQAQYVASLQAVTAGSFEISIDGTAYPISALNFAGAGSLAAVAAILQTALAAAETGTTCVWDGSEFIIRSGTTGDTSTVSFATPEGTGTDLSAMLGLTQASLAPGFQAVSTPGVALETPLQSFTNVLAIDNSWYYFAFTQEVTADELLVVGAVAQSNGLVMAYVTPDPNSLVPTATTDIGYEFAQYGYDYTFGQYDPNGAYSILAIIANLACINFNAQNSVINTKFLPETGVLPASLSINDTTVLEAKRLNYYTKFGSTAMFAEGFVGSGRFIDEVVGLDWFANAIQTAVFGYLLTQKRIPQTDKGMARLIQAISGACNQAVNNGLIAPGVWNGAPLGEYNTGDTLSKGYYVYVAPVAQQNQSQRDARIAPPFSIIACGSGAVNKVNITLNFQS